MSNGKAQSSDDDEASPMREAASILASAASSSVKTPLRNPDQSRSNDSERSPSPTYPPPYPPKGGTGVGPLSETITHDRSSNSCTKIGIRRINNAPTISHYGAGQPTTVVGSKLKRHEVRSSNSTELTHRKQVPLIDVPQQSRVRVVVSPHKGMLLFLKTASVAIETTPPILEVISCSDTTREHANASTASCFLEILAAFQTPATMSYY